MPVGNRSTGANSALRLREPIMGRQVKLSLESSDYASAVAKAL
jgi:hypothetical protein